MGDAGRMAALALAVWGAAIAPALAQDSERNRYYVQQMIELAASHDEQGVIAMQRMLEQEPRPTATDPAAAAAALQRGQAAFRQEDLNAALSAFQQASRSDPGNPDAVNYQGLIYRKLGRLTDSERALQLALALDPDRAVAWFQLAQVYGLEKDDRRALGSLANTYRYAQNPMRAEEILRNIAENETADSLRNAAVAALRLYRLPVEPAIVPPLPSNPGIVPMDAPSEPARAPRPAPTP